MKSDFVEEVARILTHCYGTGGYRTEKIPGFLYSTVYYLQSLISVFLDKFLGEFFSTPLSNCTKINVSVTKVIKYFHWVA